MNNEFFSISLHSALNKSDLVSMIRFLVIAKGFTLQTAAKLVLDYPKKKKNYKNNNKRQV